MNDKIYVNIRKMLNNRGEFPVGTEFYKFSENNYKEANEPYRTICVFSGMKLKEEKSMNKLKRGQFIIGSQLKNTGRISFSSTPKIHSSLEAARAEAERLAALDKEKDFVVVEVKGVASVARVVWH